MRMRRPVIIVVGASGASECVKATRLTGSRPLNFAPKHCGADFRSVLGPRLRATRTARDIPLSLPLSRQAVLVLLQSSANPSVITYITYF